MKIVTRDYSEHESTCCYCSPESRNFITEDLEKLAPGCVLLFGTGDYHYISLLRISLIDRPFNLILFDNHPDDQCGAFDGKMLSCGNWVKEAKEKIEGMKEIVWVKRTEDFILPDNGLPLFLSIDLDVLSRDYALTNWDQGDMTLDELKSLVELCCKSSEIIGADICGGIKKEAFCEKPPINETAEKALKEIFSAL